MRRSRARTGAASPPVAASRGGRGELLPPGSLDLPDRGVQLGRRAPLPEDGDARHRTLPAEETPGVQERSPDSAEKHGRL